MNNRAGHKLFTSADFGREMRSVKNWQAARQKAGGWAGCVFCIFVIGCLGWHLLPITLKASVIRALPFGGSYSTYDRLAGLLKMGMTTEEVSAVLGTPETQQDLPEGRRWMYDEVEATTGWSCVVDFALDGKTYRLHYFCNVEQVTFPTCRYREFGSPVDGGNFDGNWPLKKRRQGWLQQKRPNQ